MVKFRKPLLPEWRYWPATFLVTLIALAIIGISVPPSYPHDNGIRSQTNEEVEAHSTATAVAKSADDRIADYTWWLSAFTLLLVVVSGLQIFFLTRADKTARITAEAARDAVNVGAGTAEHQLRAYVFLDEAIIETGPNVFWVANVKLRNFGLTPAYDVVLTIESGVRTIDDVTREIPISKNAFVHPKNIIPPGHPATALMELRDLPFEVSDWHRVLKRTHMAFVWGRVDYVDAFKRRRWSTFQMAHFQGVKNFGPCAAGNDADH